jgi:hypothetical protein
MDITSPLPEIATYLARLEHVKKVQIPTLDDLTPELREIVDRLTSLTGSWNPVEMYTADPWSIDKEREIFLDAFRRGEEYNPRFTYSYADNFSLAGSREMLMELLEKVRLFSPRSRSLKIAKIGLYCKIKDDIATCDIICGLQERDDTLIGRALQYKYPGTDSIVMKIAEENYHLQCRRESRFGENKGFLNNAEQRKIRNLMFDSEDIKKAFEWALEQYGIQRTADHPAGFQVIIDERATAIDVRDKSMLGPTIYIPASSTDTGDRVLALIAHEIEGHARQSANGDTLFLFGGGALKVDDETLYEGLAMRHEREFMRRAFGHDDASPFPDYYAFGIFKGEMGASFHRVFLDQLSRQLHVLLRVPPKESLPSVTKIDPELYDRALQSSWGVTYRVMRGHTDMTNKARFAMPKDIAYLRGSILDAQLQKYGHGHMNEAAISSIGYLRILAEFNLQQEQLPYPFQDVATKYLFMLLQRKQ